MGEDRRQVHSLHLSCRHEHLISGLRCIRRNAEQPKDVWHIPSKVSSCIGVPVIDCLAAGTTTDNNEV